MRPQLTDDLNDFMSASAAHMTVTNTWMNTHTELELQTVPVVWFNTVLCDGNVKTIVQKLWVIEQMDCGRAGLVQDDAEARMKAGESLVDLTALMTSTVASMVASWGSCGGVVGGSGGFDGGFDGFDGGSDGSGGGGAGWVEADDSRVQK